MQCGEGLWLRILGYRRKGTAFEHAAETPNLQPPKQPQTLHPKPQRLNPNPFKNPHAAKPPNLKP